MPRLLVLICSLALLTACSSKGPPGPAPPATPEPSPIAPRSDYYSLRFKNWTDTEVDDVIQTLEGKKDFSELNHRGQTNTFSVYEVRYTGKAISGAVREALEENQLSNRAKISVSGNDVNILKTGR